MFRRLKKNLVLFNMGLLTLVFAAIFSVVAGLMVAANHGQTDMMLRLALDPQRGPFREPAPMGAILLTLDNSGEILSVSAPPQIDKSLILEASSLALAQQTEKGSFSYQTYRFAFALQNGENGRKLAILDITGQMNFLRNTLLILLGVSLLSLLVLFAVSVIFAGRAIQPVKEAFERQENFIADASHELKTPLAILNANLSVIRSNPVESVESQEKWLSAMEEQSARMNSLIADMLTLAKLDAKQDSGPVYSIDFSQLVMGCLLSFEAVAFEGGIRMETELPEGISVTGNREQLSRLIYILLDNAVRHATSGGRIWVSLLEEKGKVVFRVKNTGEISPEALPHIFDRFYRTDAARSRDSGGFGLGLAIAQSISRENHAKLFADSGDGITCFTVEFTGRKPYMLD